MRHSAMIGAPGARRKHAGCGRTGSAGPGVNAAFLERFTGARKVTMERLAAGDR
jgi:hypothetical protein